MTTTKLIELAVSMKKRAYCPYSGFAVGAALECSDGSVFTGCNIESASFSPTICAERAAAAKAVSEGHTDFLRIAVAGSGPDLCWPCGRLPPAALGIFSRRQSPCHRRRRKRPMGERDPRAASSPRFRENTVFAVILSDSLFIPDQLPGRIQKIQTACLLNPRTPRFRNLLRSGVGPRRYFRRWRRWYPRHLLR